MHWAASWSELTKTASEYASNVSEIVAPVATDDDELSLKEQSEEDDDKTKTVVVPESTTTDSVPTIQQLEHQLSQLRVSRDQMKAEIQKSERNKQKIGQEMDELKRINVEVSHEIAELDQELGELRIENQRLRRICESQELKLSTISTEQDTMDEVRHDVSKKLRDQYAEATAQAEAAMDRCQQLERALYDAQEAIVRQKDEFDAREQEILSHMQSKSSDDQRVCVLKNEIQLLEADKEMFGQDNACLKEELSNIESIMQQLQNDHKREVERISSKCAQQLEMYKKDAENATSMLAEKEAHNSSIVRDLTTRLEQKMDECEQLLRDRNEKPAVSNGDSAFDREIFSQLVINYYQSNFDREFMRLIAQMLNFNNEQLVQVGLAPAAEVIEGKSFTDLLTQFVDQS